MSDHSSSTIDESDEDLKVILIGLVRQQPSLYDPGHPDYKNRILKDKTWEQINKDIGVPDFDARKEWTKLRVYANNHRDRLKLPSGSAAPSTSSGGKKKRSEWQYTAEMQFLLPHLGQHREMETTMRRLSSGKEEPANSSTSDIVTRAVEEAGIAEDIVDVQPQTPSTIQKSTSSASKRAKTIPKKTSLDMYCEAVTKMIEQKEDPRPENPEVGWFRSLLPQIELLSPMDLLLFKTEVQQTLFRYMQNPGMQGQGQYPGMQGQGQYPGIQGQGQYPGIQGQGQYPGIQGQGQYLGIQGQGQYPGMQGQGQCLAQQERLPYASQTQK